MNESAVLEANNSESVAQAAAAVLRRPTRSGSLQSIPRPSLPQQQATPSVQSARTQATNEQLVATSDMSEFRTAIAQHREHFTGQLRALLAGIERTGRELSSASEQRILKLLYRLDVAAFYQPHLN